MRQVLPSSLPATNDRNPLPRVVASEGRPCDEAGLRRLLSCAVTSKHTAAPNLARLHGLREGAIFYQDFYQSRCKKPAACTGNPYGTGHPGISVRAGRIILPSWSCGFDSRHPLSCKRPGRRQLPRPGPVFPDSSHGHRAIAVVAEGQRAGRPVNMATEYPTDPVDDRQAQRWFEASDPAA